MRSEVRNDMSRSSQVFVDVVWPEISSMVGGGTLKLVEGNADKDLKDDLDQLAGIDGFQIFQSKPTQGGGMRSIASRVQWMPPGQPAYRTFTIRAKRPNGSPTEKEKRLHALENEHIGWLFPHLTVQAYVRKGTDELLSVGIIRTRDLFTFVRDGSPDFTRAAGNGGEVFEVYSFDRLRNNGHMVHEYPVTPIRSAGKILLNGVEVRPRKAVS